MFSYYALETWLFSFFALLLLGFIIYYTRRLITIIADIRESKKVSYKPWEMEKNLSKAKAKAKSKPKVKVGRLFGPIRSLMPVKEAAITSKKHNKTKADPRIDAVDGQISYIDANINRYPSISSFMSDETATTNSDFYRDRRLSVLEDIESWVIKGHVDQNQNVVKNNINSHISAAAVENLSANLPKVDQRNKDVNKSIDNETEVKTIKKGHPGVILVTPEINGIPLTNGHHNGYRSSAKDEIEMVSKVIPVLDESFTSSSTTIEGNNRSTITKTTSKKVTVTEVSKRKENRIAAV
ncbi:uncharacterized protein LOC107367934 [Tetranychus urticae]|uniref:Uncharacterized protein n=1 Tax=Tetranychus urticae TaxID=32264 RepID=T1JSC7_TETUR|nr:uncharacterized protein LOC107370663 [Tetranychus urticae]XP_025016254.1 uncharacterized protein LOC107367934 [Tetranychus urticae]